MNKLEKELQSMFKYKHYIIRPSEYLHLISKSLQETLLSENISNPEKNKKREGGENERGGQYLEKSGSLIG